MSAPFSVPLTCAVDQPHLLIGWVFAEGVRPDPAPSALDEAINAALARAREGLRPEVKSAIRDLLRGHGYTPSGRGKPASEYLFSAASKEAFPRINALVDLNNLISLETGWPASMLDLDRALGEAETLEIRRGQPEEGYPFNSTGQVISVKGLLVVARGGGEPVGNPVKDAMVAKVVEGTRRVIGVVYTSDRITTPEALSEVMARYGEGLQDWAGAHTWASGVIAADGREFV